MEERGPKLPKGMEKAPKEYDDTPEKDIEYEVNAINHTRVNYSGEIQNKLEEIDCVDVRVLKMEVVEMEGTHPVMSLRLEIRPKKCGED